MKMDMNKMLKQVQEMQEQMARAQEDLAKEMVEASAGGGMVKVKATGSGEIVEVTIAPEAIIPRTRRCSRTWCWLRSTRPYATHRTSCSRSSAARSATWAVSASPASDVRFPGDSLRRPSPSAARLGAYCMLAI